MSVLVSGSVAYDRIMDFPGKFVDHILPDKIHKLNVSFGLEKLSVEFGGTAGNIAYTLSLLKQRPYVVSQVGTDFAEYRQWMNRHHVYTRTIRTVRSDVCATAHIITDLSDNQIAGFHFGAMKHSALADASVKRRVKQLITPSTIGILGAGNLTDMLTLVKLYQQHQVKYIVDPGQQLVWLTGKQLSTILRGAYCLIVNDYELDLVLKKMKITLPKLLHTLPQLIVTLGGKGATWYTAGKRYRLPIAQPKRVVDPTGAGDAYRSGVIMGMLYNWDPAVAGRVAAVCATYAIEQYGTQNHHFTVDQFKKRYYKNFKTKLAL
ncbi:MAG TPA: carbohydrate kinase family protein [Candidatus Kerfeldbacteria bacterium]|nr:carbohydrate kinase family protein [Candidatus Kerfeldbacteria bacterium]